MAKMNHNRPGFQKNLAKYVPETKTHRTPELHKDHNLVSVAVPKPHYGKLVCVTCNNKFVKFVGEEEYRKYSVRS
jgi:hypothetical protein